MLGGGFAYERSLTAAARTGIISTLVVRAQFV